MERTKEVRFDLYCNKCKYENVVETNDPCNDCLSQGWNEDSHKPTRFKRKEEDDAPRKANKKSN